MRLINCSHAYDGQGAFRNGMHDHCSRVPLHDNLYRRVGPRSPLNRALWWLGWVFQRVTGLGYVSPLPFALWRKKRTTRVTWN